MISLSSFLNRKFANILLLSNFITLVVFLLGGTVWGFYSNQVSLRNEITNSSAMITTLMYDKNWDVITQHLDSLVSIQNFSEVTLKSLNGDILTKTGSKSFSLIPRTCTNQDSQIFNMEACAPVLSQNTMNLIIGVILFYSLILVFIYMLAKNYFLKAMNSLVKDVEGILSEEPLTPSTAEIIEIQNIKENFIEKTNRLKQAAEDDAYINFSKKLVHDLMSPISVISQLTSKQTLDSKDIRYLKETSVNLESISNSLLHKKNNVVFSQNMRFNISKEARNIVSLKSIEHSSKKIRFSSNINEDVTFWINPTSFKRIISNLLNNSIQASVRDEVHFSINLSQQDSCLILSFHDDGEGFKETTLEILNSGVEFSTKSTGHGFGLGSLRDYINSLGGKTVFSNKNNSACIEIHIPENILSTSSPIVLIDDDKYIRYAWEQEAKLKGFKLFSYSSYEDFFNSSNSIGKDSEIFIDSDLKQGERGEELVESILALGFYRVSIESGRRQEEFKNFININDVISKKFPY